MSNFWSTVVTDDHNSSKWPEFTQDLKFLGYKNFSTENGSILAQSTVAQD